MLVALGAKVNRDLVSAQPFESLFLKFHIVKAEWAEHLFSHHLHNYAAFAMPVVEIKKGNFLPGAQR